VNTSLDAAGAPFDQGLAQGRALAREIRQGGFELRRRYGLFAWSSARRGAHRGSGRSMQRFLPQMHERLRGIAAGAQVPDNVLELAENLRRVNGVARVTAAGMDAFYDLPPEQLVLRRSLPDAVGFASVEVALAPFSGCLAGVNSEGVAVCVLEDRGAHGPSLRSYAQDLLMRASDVAGGAGHLRQRADYAGGDGSLLAVDRSGNALQLTLEGGAVTTRPVVVQPASEAPLVRIAVAKSALRLGGREPVSSSAS
jgi:hypothetical protein